MAALVGGQDFGDDLVDAELGPDALRGRAVVTGEHDDIVGIGLVVDDDEPDRSELDVLGIAERVVVVEPYAGGRGPAEGVPVVGELAVRRGAIALLEPGHANLVTQRLRRHGLRAGSGPRCACFPETAPSEERVALLLARAGSLAATGQFAESHADLLGCNEIVPRDAEDRRVRVTTGTTGRPSGARPFLAAGGGCAHWC